MPKKKKHIQPTGRATIRNIADYAGVSIAAVSSVLNNLHVERRISEATVAKVRRAAAQLGYLPNIGARRLRRGESVRNSVVFALITSFEAPIPLVKHFIFALRQLVAKGGFPQAGGAISVMVEMFTAGRLREMPGLLTGDHFNAAIILNTTAVDDAFLAKSKLPYPTVVVNRSIPGYSSVMEAPDSGARVAEVLTKKRRRRLGVLHGNPWTQITRVRVNSFTERTIALLGRPAEEVVATTLSETAGYEAMRAYLKERGSLDGLYSVSDALALGAYRAIKEAGLRIPDDIAVIGVGDYEIAPFFDPPLSCVGVSHQQLAERASQLLFAQLEGKGHSRHLACAPILEMLRASSGHE